MIDLDRQYCGPSELNLHKWCLVQSPSCDCGQWQTMDHIVNMCPLTTFEGALKLLHEANDDTVIWLELTATTAVVKWNEAANRLTLVALLWHTYTDKPIQPIAFSVCLSVSLSNCLSFFLLVPVFHQNFHTHFSSDRLLMPKTRWHISNWSTVSQSVCLSVCVCLCVWLILWVILR